MTEQRTQRRHYWQRITTDGGGWAAGVTGPPGAELAALRSGINREAGDAPRMWPFYTTLTVDGRRSIALQAEHVALTLFALHQQSRPLPMHKPKTGVGTAIRALRDRGTFSPDAVDRRFAAAANATTLGELRMHLRGLITQLRGIGQPLDYNRLYQDLCDWQWPERRPTVRRRWGAQYFAHDSSDDTKPATSTTTTSS